MADTRIVQSDFRDYRRDRFVDARTSASARLAPTLMLTNEQGVSCELGDELGRDDRARVEFDIPSAQVKSAELLFYVKGADPTAARMTKSWGSLFSRTLLEIYPRSDFAAAAQFTLADDAYNRQSYEEAMLAYELVQARFPDDPVAAQVPRILSEIEEAIAYEHYEQAVALMDSAEAVEKGAVRKQYFERAVSSFQDISTRYPDTESAIGALSNMGVCLEGLGKWRDAVEIYDQVIEMYEDKRASKEVFQFAKAHRDWIVSTRL